MEFFHSFEDFDLTDVIESLSPLTLMKVASGKNNMVSAVLSNELHSLHVILLDELSEIPAYDHFRNIELIFADVWHLQKQRCCHIHAVNDFQIDLQMRWNESLLLFVFFLASLLLLLSEVAGSLCKTFFEFWTLAYINEDLVAFVEETKSEGAQTDLDDCSVINDLDSGWLICNCLTEVGFHY